MELEELTERLEPFIQAKLDAPAARITNTWMMPGHAGFSYGFTVDVAGEETSYYMRLPPPNVKLEGTADVLRQVRILNALRDSKVPVAKVIWSGDDPQWFGRPFFVTEHIEGDTFKTTEGEWGATLSKETVASMAEQAMRALANIHLLEWEQSVPELGPPVPFDEDVTRWDRFYERAAEPQLLSEVPKVRELLLEKAPTDARIGVFHGDYQWSNLLYSYDGTLRAVIDWELVNIGACLNDLGWITAFSTPDAWAHEGAGGGGKLPDPDQLIEWYVDEYGTDPGDINWFRALACYKFAIITGLNLSLHRRGKRPDPHWEDIKDSMPTLTAYALKMLGA
ncbi:MAG: phosphotransferase family protein [Dehalococcoidia bacterium]|nr:phosphotransferase family protein [Dehalococcoidia bacterium]